MDTGLEAQKVKERARSSLWFVPAAIMLLAAIAAVGLAQVPTQPGSLLAHIGWSGDVNGARTLLQLLASSVITVTSLTFSLALVAMQLAASNFSPRLLRTFVRKPVFQVTLGVFLATFVYCLLVLRRLTATTPVPHVAMLGALLLAIASVAALVWFLARILTELRVEAMMSDARAEAMHVLKRTFPEVAEGSPDADLPEPGEKAVPVRARRSGFVQAVDPALIRTWAAQRDLVIRIDVCVGERVVTGLPCGWVWPREPTNASTIDPNEVSRAIFDGLEVGFERTPQQDLGFGFRQLTDIVVKAMSPAINDPTTAAHAIGHLAELLCALARHSLGPHLARDSGGVLRVAVAGRVFDDFLDLACAQPRRFGGGEPAIVAALLELLRDVALVVDGEPRRNSVRRQIDLVVRAAERQIPEERDLEPVYPLAATARHALTDPNVTPRYTSA